MRDNSWNLQTYQGNKSYYSNESFNELVCGRESNLLLSFNLVNDNFCCSYVKLSPIFKITVSEMFTMNRFFYCSQKFQRLFFIMYQSKSCFNVLWKLVFDCQEDYQNKFEPLYGRDHRFLVVDNGGVYILKFSLHHLWIQVHNGLLIVI